MTKNKLLLVSVLTALAGVSVAQAEPGAGQHFAKLDTDGDGVVTTVELQNGALARFAKSDADKDGKVTSEEMTAQREAHQQERFSKRDSNTNGVLERNEVARMPDAFFTQVDVDGSGTLSITELHNAKLARHGKGDARGDKGLRGDMNGDGVLTQAEAVESAARFSKKLDENGDGKLSQEELKSKRGRHHGAPARGDERGERGGDGGHRDIE